MKKISIAVVTPRFGHALGGGAETLLYSLLERAANGTFSSHSNPPRDLYECEGHECEGYECNIEVWTTCAEDHRTWENALLPGTEDLGWTKVRRFPVDERDIETFIRVEMLYRDGVAVTIEDQLSWLRAGVNSAALYQHIRDNEQYFDLILFIPYLFPTTFWGALICPDKAVLIPCLHDEAYAYLDVMQYLFKHVRGLIFNTVPEANLAKKIFGREVIEHKSQVVGMGFSPSKQPTITAELNAEWDTSKTGTTETGTTNTRIAETGTSQLSSPLKVSGPYLLYSGRKEEGKNLHLLIEYFDLLRQTGLCPDIKLKLIGSGSIAFRETLPEGVYDLGFVDEEAKKSLLRGALALVHPSVNESFSIVIMEAWSESVPVVVNEFCSVTLHHARNSNGGLWFSTFPEFAAVIHRLYNSPTVGRALGENGKAYVERVYSWAEVGRRWNAALDLFTQSTAQNDAKNHGKNAEHNDLSGNNAVASQALGSCTLCQCTLCQCSHQQVI